ncbi:MAB_1171c family putative transporter [Kitasatospora sp. NPDC056138]|uniref:MAB_1171c family putative transporter n=1 Tax=Kitasatospora sp. NPDC056138 TaxID=3345724 RepID=UPI0035D7C7FC
MAVDLVHYLASAVAAALWAVLLLLNRGRTPDPAVRHGRAFAFCLAVAMALLAPSTLAELHRLRPDLDWPMLAGDEMRGAAVYCLTRFAFALRPPGSGARPARIHRRASAVAALGAVLLFAAADVRVHGGAVVVAGPGRPAMAGYNLLATVYTTGSMAVFVVLMGRRSRDCAQPLLRLGLRLIVLSGLVGVLWCAWGLDDVSDVLTAGSQSEGEDTLSAVLGIATTAPAVAGATVSLWGGGLVALGQRLYSYRCHRRLEPLWSALHEALPEIALDPAGRGPLGLPHGARFALYRRVIEIHDARLALRPYRHPDAAAWARELDPDCRPETVEAAAIAAAVELVRAGRRLAAWTAAGAGAPAAGATAASETDWLVRVARAYRSAPVVAAVRDRVRAELGTPAR